jgi:3-oxoacyl-(acyl-carrier-protein) synthase
MQTIRTDQSRLRVFQPGQPRDGYDEPVVITGIGMITSVGHDRESVWRAIQSGVTGIRALRGVSGIPDFLTIGAVVDLPRDFPGQLKVTQLARIAAAEAIADSRIDLETVDPDRFGCAISGHMGDTQWWAHRIAPNPGDHFAHFLPDQWMPHSACSSIARQFRLQGPRICHSTACASGLIDIMSAVRSIRDGQCDLALAGSAEAIDPLFAAGFKQMRVLAEHAIPAEACRPFDRHRSGFVMGEGGAMFVLERLSHARQRGATIYAEIVSGKMLADAHHMTGLDIESDALSRLINETLRAGSVVPDDIGYINAHGTGTAQNDLMETRGIRRSFGKAADTVCVSSTKAILGHLVNASGSVELALTTLSLRDGFVPATANLTSPDPECDLDCVPLVGRVLRHQHALKLSLAFGGHLVAVLLRRWNDAQSGFAYPAAAASADKAA